MILIIAEKPSLARNIVAGIGKLRKVGNYYEGSGYIVTWSFGHLFSLCDIEDYTGPTSNNRWSMENIPCFPEKFKFQLRKDKNNKPDDGVKKQFNTIKELCNRADVDKIVNAGDADREGEIIIRLCIMNALEKPKELLRLWLPDQTPETVAKALGELKKESEYDNLANEGFSRTYIDWLYGVNLTRYATLKTGVLLRVGRVIVPIVKAIYDRDMAIKNFVSETYYAVVSKELTNGETVELTSKKKFDKNEKSKAEELCRLYNSEKAVVIGKKTKKDTLNPGKLYSLSKLQNVLGKKYKMSMDQSLKIVQDLYERGYLTYPRTNSEYLATTEKDKVKKILEIVKKIGYPVEFKSKKSIFDDSKIESHSALTPTYKIPQKSELSDDEMKVYQTVFRRFVAVFCSQECIAQKSELTVKVGDYEEFVLNGMIILERGWTRFDDYSSKNKILPALEIGDEVVTNFCVKDKKTSPPKHYTIETLNNYLKNPFREDKSAENNCDGDDDSEDYKAIFEGLELGTEATRTGIIDNARKSKYIDLKKDVYYILPDGIYLIESLMQMQISMDKYKTSTVGRALKRVYRGEITVDDSIKLAEDEISLIFNRKSDREHPETDVDNGFYGDKVGVCPLCGGEVVKGRYGYGCMNYKQGCKFRISGVICKRIISKTNAELLLERGRTSKIQGFTSKNGKLFDAVLVLNDGKIEFSFD